MKIKTILFALFLTASLSSFAQSFEKGSLVGEVGTGLGIYHTEIKDKQVNITEKDTSGGWLFPVMVEYGVLDMVGVAGGIKYTNYIEGNDSVNSSLGVNGFDVVIRPAFHFVRSKRVDMYAGFTAGLAYLQYKANDANDTRATGFGPTFAGNLGVRFYFSDVIGMYIAYGFNTYHYPNFKFTSNTTTTDIIYDYKGKGGNYGLGLVFKIK